MPKKRKNYRRKKQAVLLAALLILVVGGVLLWHGTRGTPKVSAPSTPISKLSTQTSTNNTEKKLNSTSTVNQGTSTDNNGQTTTPVTTNPSQWAQSASGVIVLKQPIAKSTFKPDDTISGTAKTDKVEYRLIDDQAGVISEGTINVVNGDFSAAVHFKPYAQTGRLDVYTTTTDGAEQNELQIDVNF